MNAVFSHSGALVARNVYSNWKSGKELSPYFKVPHKGYLSLVDVFESARSHSEAFSYGFMVEFFDILYEENQFFWTRCMSWEYFRILQKWMKAMTRRGGRFKVFLDEKIETIVTEMIFFELGEGFSDFTPSNITLSDLTIAFNLIPFTSGKVRAFLVNFCLKNVANLKTNLPDIALDHPIMVDARYFHEFTSIFPNQKFSWSNFEYADEDRPSRTKLAFIAAR